jgi:hypothetical protein
MHLLVANGFDPLAIFDDFSVNGGSGAADDLGK